MPIYEYCCDACGAELEVLQKLSDAPLSHCPQCGAADFRKKVSAAGFRLKGGGWYVTDFKNSGKNTDKAGASADKPKEGSGDAAAPAATKPADDAKPAPVAKPAAKPAATAD